jgi:hypothetical protein
MHWNHQNTFLISWDYPFKSWTADVVITVEKVRVPNADLLLGGSIKQWKEVLIVMSVDYTLRWLSIELIVACCITKPLILFAMSSVADVLHSDAAPNPV